MCTSRPSSQQHLGLKNVREALLELWTLQAFAVQSYVTGEGPYANWAKHVSGGLAFEMFPALSIS